ncbi:MAG: InlB B-repeat-containing protein [Bacilli bacterium]|nr:InlB B-repeat-containing protein [Bacilli bacterium]
MKKISNLFLTTLLVFVFLALAGCANVTYKVTFETNGGSKIEDVIVEQGKTISAPETPTKEGYKFIGWFNDKELTEKFVFENPITKDTIIYAKWQLKEDVNQIFVNGVSQRSEFVAFDANKQVKENKRNEFFGLNNTLYAGIDNPFIVMPEVTFVEINVETKEVVNDDVTPESWSYDITVYEVTADEEVKLEESSEMIDKIDSVNCSVDFSEKAVGKKFLIEVVPQKLTEKQLQKVENYTTSVYCSVVEGYNVYNALDFAYAEHRNEDDDANSWKKFKEEKGLNLDYIPKALILQSDINVTADDMPASFFWSEEEVKGASDADRALGSVKDYKNLYRLDLGENDSFAIHGNYFTLDVSTIKEVVRERDKITPEGEVISHASFIRFEGAGSSNVVIESVNLVGNAPRVENAIKSGGLIFTKVEGPTFTAYNNISIGWFIAYMPNRTDAEFRMEQCKAYDSYNCFVYNWGSPLVYIDKCEMVGAGGPVIIQDHVNPKNGGNPGNTYIIDSKLESYVTGSEGWFKGVHADMLVPVIKGCDAAFNPFGRSFLKSNADKSLTYLNLICVNKSGDAESLQPQIIEGEVKIDSLPSFDFGKTNPYVKALIDATYGTESASFQTSANGCAYITTSGLFGPDQKQIIDPTAAIYQGDYLAMYYNGTMILFGFNKYNPTTGSYEIYTPAN